MKNELISVIIPLYNTEQYIEECLESIINQTYENLEIIVVDNCSIDSSLSRVNRIAKKDSRIKIIKNDRTYSAGYSRNVGIENSTGQYLWFMDSDDKADPEFAETMLKQLQDNPDINIVQCCYKSFGDFGDEKDYLPFHKTKVYSGKELCKIMNEFIGLCGPNTMIWNKLYRKEVWCDRRFYENVYYEDMYLMYKILYDEDRVLWIENRLMNWRKRILSDTAVTNYSKMCIHEIYAYIERADFYLKNNEQELYELTMKRLYYISTQHLYLTDKYLKDDDKEKRINILLTIIKAVYKKLEEMKCWKMRTRIRMRFIYYFPFCFGRICTKHKLDFRI